ncbi:DUF2087 domain-containing protein [Ramlibacter sp. XY19]|uniref:DUF2087 domain-containing protein n=1 Tax=Ramlibacter paludis TaxID=2908000 RepID=UPI0023DA613E|nr:DUF2087 domain-containing protein [Ramlibacter paludis]MCG2593864.1 DUF2087 domain-containing protein [Ramlibacter paludis]
MTRETTPLLLADLSRFARNLGKALATRQHERPEPPGHVELLNLVARAAGFRNLQALKAARPATVPSHVAVPLSDGARRALAHFDAQGRLVRWPTKFSVQGMAMWVLWTRFDAKRVYSESEVNTILKAANAFGDHVTLRRELVKHRLLARKPDCSAYWKLPARPGDEVRALLTAWRARAAAAA